VPSILLPPRVTGFPAMNSQAILGQLVAFDTTSRNSNLALLDWVQNYLHGLGIKSELLFNDARSKANLYARIGPDIAGGVMLSGHTDVVPVDGQEWTVPPFEMTQSDGKLYGRGAADMKGFIACVLSALPHFLQRALQQPLHIALSYDEEIGCLGVPSLVNALAQREHMPVLCIVGEPTGLQPVIGHKGKLAMRCTVHGASCHSADPARGVNAIEYAAKLVNRLGEFAQTLAASGHHDARFDPPYSSVQTGMIQGGSALNIVPEHCHFDFEMRHLPHADPQQMVNTLSQYAQRELLPRMRAVHPHSAIEFTELSRYPGLLSAPDNPAVQLVCELTGRTDFTTVAFGSEAGLFDSIGIATVVCGPGSMEQGHQADEFIGIEQLAACDALLVKLAQWMGEKVYATPV